MLRDLLPWILLGAVMAGLIVLPARAMQWWSRRKGEVSSGALARWQERQVPTVYLAGPMVFEPAPGPIFEAMKEICARHGVRGVSPLDNQMALEGAPGHALVTRIVAADIALMRQVDAGVFCLDGFRRGPEMDPGTAFEIGYMHALGKPLAGWTRDVADYPARVERFFRERFGVGLVEGKVGEGVQSGVLRDLDGVLVHSEGCFQNAMTQVGIERSGGRVFADGDWAVAFEAAVADLAGRLRG